MAQALAWYHTWYKKRDRLAPRQTSAHSNQSRQDDLTDPRVC